MENGKQGVRIQLVRLHKQDGGVGLSQIPLRCESEGIKTIVSFPHLFIVTYNSPDVTLAIDELDSGTFEHLLGEPLQIMQDSGKGQLIFTSHNLRPLEVLERSSIIFTTTNRENCCTRRANLKPGNNLRHCYYRDITLGSDGEELYKLFIVEGPAEETALATVLNHIFTGARRESSPNPDIGNPL